jgi:protein-disulfide isomerase
MQATRYVSGVGCLTRVRIGLIVAFALQLGLPSMASTARAGEALAEVNGDTITADEVERSLATQLGKLQEQIYTLKRQRLEALIRERLLAQEAAKRGVSVPALLDAEVTPKVRLVTEEDVEKIYQANKARFTGNEAEAQERIRSQLQGQQVAAQREAFIRGLRLKSNVKVHLEAPPVVRAQVSVDGAPAKGPATAPVTIVEFSDFYCPFCKRVQSTLSAILAKYGDKVRLVYRDFPIPQLHPAAPKAAEAARCANDQGKFWPYHDLLYARAPKGSPDDLTAYANEVGLDVAAFEACLTSGKHAAGVKKDIEEGNRLGIDGTPGFFVNGRPLAGAQPLEAFVTVIEDELARAK